MSKDVNIHVEHLTRVEGHGDIYFNAREGKLEKVEWHVTEAPRFFEAMVRGKSYVHLQPITSRICGICSIGHSLASLKATEEALGVSISHQTEILRRLALHAENMQSHMLHIGYLVVPDLFRVGSVFPIVEKNKDAVVKIVSLHRLANFMSDLICGRTTHPIRLAVGGFRMVPTRKELEDLRARLDGAKDTIDEIASLLASVKGALPDFERETEYIGLVHPELYALYDGDIGSTDTGTHPVNYYRSITNEYVVPQSTAKYTKHNRESYFTGALARYNLNYAKLSDYGKNISTVLGLEPPIHNTFMNTYAQMVEYADSVQDSINILDELLEGNVQPERADVKPRAGRGIGAVEVPRGILFHDYTLDRLGNCTKANCIIPTNQNHANIQKDMEAIAPSLVELPENEIELTLEMLVRAYDPCISCSTHFLKVHFIR
ncbi:MAG: Ni/Fe hydrogenase subunit alpha [Candidatus Thermoplasmatota archaeon]|nr:Ni/Fe hydrogenase subunit alpha [Candidatus Thermoplasmatota archaeon]